MFQILKTLPANSYSPHLQWFSNRPWYKHFQDFFLIYKWGLDTCESALNSTVIKNILNVKKSYDVILVEQFNNDCMMAVAWKLKAPVIGLSSCALMPWHYDRLGSPFNPSYMPTIFTGSSDDMNLRERLNNWVIYHVFNILYR